MVFSFREWLICIIYIVLTLINSFLINSVLLLLISLKRPFLLFKLALFSLHILLVLWLEHLRDVFLLPRKNKFLVFIFYHELLPWFLINKFSNILVVGLPQLFMHKTHHSDIVIVEKINFLQVNLSRQIPILISKEKFRDVWWFKFPNIVLVLFRNLSLQCFLFLWRLFGLRMVLSFFGCIFLWFNNNASFLERCNVALNVFKWPYSEPKVKEHWLNMNIQNWIILVFKHNRHEFW